MCSSDLLGLYNRVAMGTGHGWAAVNSVVWNADVDASYGVIGLQQPPTAQNYAIGCQAKKITDTPVQATSFPLGYVEGQNQTGVEPQSLYLYQKALRTGNAATLGGVESDEGRQAVKELRNGVLYIRRNNRQYTLLGTYAP